jgi:hypothetical protein
LDEIDTDAIGTDILGHVERLSRGARMVRRSKSRIKSGIMSHSGFDIGTKPT